MKQTPHDHLLARREAALSVVAALNVSLKNFFGFDREEIQALMNRIANCASLENNFIVEDAWNHETGEAYDAHGQFWRCGSKLCPNCIARQARHNRKILREAIGRQRLRPGERYYFVTFTIVNPSLSLNDTRDIVDRTWTLFRKRKLCTSLVRGGCKSEEFTLTPNGYHYHLHCIFLSKWMQFQEARRVWTECQEIAFAEAQVPLKFETKDNMGIVKFKTISDHEKAIQETCKYITKSDSWAKMNPEHLGEVALVKRWFRMFEVFGSFRSQGEATDLNDEAPEGNEPIVHTRSLYDGKSRRISSYWRDRVAEIGIERYTDELNAEIANVWEVRKQQIAMRWPGAKLRTLREIA